MLNILVSNPKEYSPIRLGSGSIVLGRAPRAGGLSHTIQDEYCSANQLQVEELPGYRVRLSNMSTRVSVAMSSGLTLEPGASSEASLPLRLKAGKTVIEIEAARPDQDPAGSLSTISQPIALRARSPMGPDQVGRADQTVTLSASEWPTASLS